jgi:hypothetical protein
MIAKLFVSLAAITAVLANPLSSSAECFPLKSSKGGADLYMIGSQATVRVERIAAGYDVGIKVDSGLTQDSKRIEVKESESAELVGEQFTKNGQKLEVAKVYISMGQLVIIAQGKALIKDLSGQTEDEACMKVKSTAHYFINQAMSNYDKPAKSVRLQIASTDQIAGALGL